MITQGYYAKVEKMTIIEILNKVAAGTFARGTEFIYNGLDYIFDGEDIRTVEKDYFDGDVKVYEFLFNDIDLTNLNDEVIMKNDVFTVAPTAKTGVVATCPVCRGTGHVAGGFYSSTGNTWVTSTTAPEQCRSCSGKGYIII